VSYPRLPDSLEELIRLATRVPGLRLAAIFPNPRYLLEEYESTCARLGRAVPATIEGGSGTKLRFANGSEVEHFRADPPGRLAERLAGRRFDAILDISGDAWVARELVPPILSEFGPATAAEIHALALEASLGDRELLDRLERTLRERLERVLAASREGVPL